MAATVRDTSIKSYRAKRDFQVTPEPAPARRRRAAKAGPIFVVQKHAARRLHYDFRLEHNGVLLSWAVPKGPSLDPADKRLAVHVEDHPLDYATFEGVIPEGNYGAGAVDIWDHGTWTPLGNVDEDVKRGELKFDLQGEKLHGRFVLVRMKPRPKERVENWLLIKEHDSAEEKGTDAIALEQRTPRRHERSAPAWTPPDDAVQAPMPDHQAFMLAGQTDTPPEGDEWLSEIKFDGYRVMARKIGSAVTLLTRNGLDWTRRFGGIADAVRECPAETMLADGEIVALRRDGVSCFSTLQDALAHGRKQDLTLYLFDLLYRDGWDLRNCPLVERKKALAELVPPNGTVRISEHLTGVSAAMREQACKMGLEGIICKRADSPYSGTRSRAWLKVKCQGREEFVIVGYTKPQRSRTGLGSIHLGFYDSDGHLHYIGGCGSGFGDETLASLSALLAKLRTDPPPDLLLTDEKPPRDIIWVKPDVVAEVQYTSWSGGGRLRHAVFLGLRQDKPARDVVRDIPDPDAKRRALGAARREPRIVTASKPAPRGAEFGSVRLTHPDRELWPGITKQMLAEYWREVASHALPGIAGRPLALVRCPEGVNGEHFFQKHANKGMAAGLREGSFEGAPYLALDGEEGLIGCAQMSAIELHAWGSTEADAGRPDQLVFDLDPGDGVAWDAVIDAAHDLRARLKKTGLTAFPRTTGGKGLHLVVPLTPSAGWEEARPWCRAFAEECEKDEPERYVASIPKARRHGRILIDWLRNGLGSTAVASFSPRAREGATVATPLPWSEVTPHLDPKAWNLATVPERLRKTRRDPWHGFGSARAVLPVGKGKSHG